MFPEKPTLSPYFAHIVVVVTGLGAQMKIIRSYLKKRIFVQDVGGTGLGQKTYLRWLPETLGEELWMACVGIVF